MAIASPRSGPGSTRSGAGKVRRAGAPDRVFAVGAFAMFVVLWIGFAMVALGDPTAFDSTWQWLRGLPTPIAQVVWVVFLPLTVGLWIWETTWPPAVGLLLGAGMACWTLVAVAGLVRAMRGA